jgi:type IV secretory pathway VirB9-like protein
MRRLTATLCVLTIGFLLIPATRSLVAQTPSGIREVTASSRGVIPIQTRLRYTTMIVLPDDDEILDVICGDKDFWVVSATKNVAHVKPAKERSTTNLNLVTRKTIYSFLVSEKGDHLPDLTVYVTSDEAEARATPRYYSVRDVAALESELRDARASIEAAQRRANETISAFQQQYPARLQFAYGPLKYERPFFVRAIWHDGQRTFLKTDARELPALYEVQDGGPALIDYQVHQGTYVAAKVIEQGYLALGKTRFHFSLRAR